MQLRLQPWHGTTGLVIASALVVGGCGSTPQPAPPLADASNIRSQPALPSSKPLPALPPAGSGRGAYYQDDGPGDAPPEGLYDIPDAEPKVEPYTQRGNRPYVVFGKPYAPFTDARPFKQRGIGSWYGKKFHGQKTSSGEIYDMYKMTAAHPTLPLPSYVRVTNLSNGKQVIVRVNDRGPFHSGRIIDLSYTAALKLGYIAKGSAELEVERLLPDEIAQINSARQGRPADSPTVAVSGNVHAVAATLDAVPSEQADRTSSSISVPPVTADKRAVAQAAELPVSGTAQANISGAAAGGFYLQLGAYASAAGAETVRNRLAQSWDGDLPPLEVIQSGSLHRVYSGPFASRGEADAASRRIKAGGTADPVVVRR
jgi:rare lipoprotein A